MCEHCGCETFGPLQTLHGEHVVVQQLMVELESALRDAEPAEVTRRRDELLRVLRGHNAKEEAGVYAQLMLNDPAYVGRLGHDHADIDRGLNATLDTPGGRQEVAAGLRLLREHIFTEELDTYPYAFQTLGSDQWERVETAHALVDAREPGVGAPCQS
jgi:Hemerythrin HHE cation binding domain